MALRVRSRATSSVATPLSCRFLSRAQAFAGSLRHPRLILLLALMVIGGASVRFGVYPLIGLERGSNPVQTDAVSATGPEAGHALEDRVEISWSTAAAVSSTSLFTIRRDGTLLGVVASNIKIFEDFTAVPGRSYQYCVGIQTPNGATPINTPVACDSGGRLIARPTGFTASDGVFEDQVLLNWTDQSQIEGGYNIYREGGRALMFDGVDDYVSTAYVDIPSSFTFEFWARRASLNTPDFVLNIEAPPLGDPSRRDLEIGFLADNRFSVGFGTDLLNTPTPQTDLEWHHWAVVYDAPSRRRMIFRDGTLLISDVLSGPYASAGQLEFGRRRKAGNAAMRGHFHGQLDEIRFWNRALTLDEVVNSMTSLLRRDQAGLANYWPLDAESGLVAHDVAGTFNGTLQNMPAGSWTASSVPPRYARTAANINTFSDRTAVPGFTYTYKVAAYEDVNDDGRYTQGIDYESERRTDTGWRGLLSPPGNVAATEGQFLDRVRITWTDRSASEDGFRVYRAGQVIGTVPANTATFDDLTAVALETYSYCVTSFAAGIESIQVCDDGRAGGLSAPENVVASRDEFDDRIRVTWDDVSATEDGFEIFRNGTLLTKVAANAKEHNDLTARQSVDYDYCVRAFSNIDPLNPSYSDQACGASPGRRASVLAPGSLTATKGDFEERVDLRWTNRSTTAMLFLLYRDATLIEVLDHSRLTASDRAIPSDTDVNYCVASATVVNQSLDAAKATVSQVLHNIRAQDAVLVQSGSQPSTAEMRMETVYEALGFQASAGKASSASFEAGYVESPTVCDIGSRSLKAPIITEITTDLESHVKLTWSDNSQHEVGYVITRTASGGIAARVDSISANRTTYSDYKGAPGITYSYSVRAVDNFGVSTSSSRNGLRTLNPPTQFTATDGASETEVRLAWRDNSSAEVGYKIYRRSGIADFVLLDSTGRNEPAYVDIVPSASRAVRFDYQVAAYDLYGESIRTDASGKTFIQAPANVNASTVYADQVVVVWVDRSAVEDSFLVTRREVGRPTPDQKWLLAANTTRYVDLTGTLGLDYEYCVSSLLRGGSPSILSTATCAVGRKSLGATAGNGGGGNGTPTEGPARVTNSSLTSNNDGALRFGFSVAASGDSLALIGVPGADPKGLSGLYRMSASRDWGDALATFAPGANPGSEYGHSVAISGNYAVIGDPQGASDANGGFGVWRRQGNTWTNFLHVDMGPNAGTSVAIVDSFIVVGDDQFGSSPSGHGKALFCNVEADPDCSDAVRLDGLLSGLAANAGLGSSVDITRVKNSSDDRLYAIVGAPGAQRAYVFECDLEAASCNDGAHWQAKAPSTLSSPYTGNNRRFGAAVAVEGALAVVGDPGARGVVVYQRGSDEAWNQAQNKRENSIPEFGYAIDILGSTVIIGAPGERVGDRDGAGTAYVYQWTTLLEQIAKYDSRVADTPQPQGRFGASVALGDGVYLVGAPGEGSRGAAYGIPAGFVAPTDPIIPIEVTLNAPSRVRASDGTAPDRIQIRWTDNAENENGHVIFRSIPGGDFERLAEVSQNVEFYDDFAAAPGEAYTYCVAAFSMGPYVETDRACDIGWRPANGTIAGRVFAAGGAGTDDAEVCLSPSVNRGLIFDGHQGFVEVGIPVDEGASSPLTLLTNFTIEAWIRPESVTGIQGLISPNGAYSLALDGADLSFTVDESVVGAKTYKAGQTLSIGTWYHVAVVKNDDNNVVFYVDGVAVKTEGSQNLLQDTMVDSLRIGRLMSGAGYFRGEIDEVRIWSTTRSAAQIADSRFAALSGREESLAGYWPLDEGARRVVPDLTPAANHGTLQGGVYLADTGADLNVCGRTSADGNFSMSRIRYGETTEFDVIPTRANRKFSPSFKKITLSIDSPVQNEVFFNDITAYTVAGSIFYLDEDDEPTTCPVPDVVIHVGKASIAADDNVKTTTAADGSYSVSVDPSVSATDPWFIIPRGPSTASAPHVFSPTNKELDVRADTLGVNFFSRQRHLLTGNFSGGDPGTCGQDIGVAQIRIYTQDGCFDEILTVDSRVSNGAFSIELPPLEYLVEVIGVTNAPADRQEDIDDFFKRLGSVEVNLTGGSVARNLTYRAPLTLVIAGLEPTASCPSGLTQMVDNAPIRILPNVRVIDEYDFVPLTFRVTEDYGNGNTCNVGDGTVTIFDAIADRVDTDSTMTLNNGVVDYVTQGTSPNIFSGARIGGVDRSFQKPITVVAQVEGRPALMETEWAIVNGFRERSATFVSATTEEIPLMILHDPPGSNSVAFIEKGSTHCTRFSKLYTVGGAGGVDVDVAIGFKTDNGFSLGVHTSFTAGGALLLRTRTVAGEENTFLQNRDGDTSNSESNIEICATTTEEWRTSDDPGWVGEDAVMGVALNLIFALADVLEADATQCTLDLSETLATDLDNAQPFETTYVYGRSHIENNIIPQLAKLIELGGDATLTGDIAQTRESVRLREALINWQKHLALIDKNKTNAVDVTNHSFSGGVDVSVSRSADSTRVTSLESKRIYVNSENTIGAVFTVGYDNVLAAAFEVNAEWVTEKETTQGSSRTIGYTLSDGDGGDYFSVNIGKDPRYGTYVFNTVAGRSSNPCEDNTQCRDNPIIMVDPPVRHNVSPSQAASFQLTLINASESMERRRYVLDAPPENNPGNLALNVGGGLLTAPREYLLDPGKALTINLDAYASPSTFSYENVAVMLYPPDEWPIWAGAPDFPFERSDTAFFSVHFDESRGNMLTAQMKEGWNWFSINSEGGDVGTVLGGVPAQHGDILRSQTAESRYDSTAGWIGGLTRLTPGPGYRIRLKNSTLLRVEGEPVEVVDPMELAPGWTWIGYMPTKRMTPDDAMISLNGRVIQGDAIVGKESFSHFVKDVGWVGTLRHMLPGESYAIHMHGGGQLLYPTEVPDRAPSDPYVHETTTRGPEWTIDPGLFDASMTVVAEIQLHGVPLRQTTSKVAAFAGTEIRGLGEIHYVEALDRYLTFMMLFGDINEETPLVVHVFDGETDKLYEEVATINYSMQARLGQPASPVVIDLANAGNAPALTDLPESFALHANFPNPFNTYTVIPYDLPEASNVRVVVFDMLGRRVATLVDGHQSAGRHRAVFNAQTFASGVYFYRLEMGDTHFSGRMVLVK